MTPPTLSTIKFTCQCLNRGSCIHYQICFRRDHLPDGLICAACRVADTPQEVLTAKRKCPRHVDDTGTEKNFFPSRPEDFLPSDEQRARYEGWMGRIARGEWDVIAWGMGGRGAGMMPSERGLEGPARIVPPRSSSLRRTARRTLTTSRSDGSGHQPGRGAKPTMRRAYIEPLSDTRQVRTQPMMLSPPAWPIASPYPAPNPTQAANQAFFNCVSNSPPQLFNSNAVSPRPQPSAPIGFLSPTAPPPNPRSLEQAHAEALADDAERTLRVETRRMGIPNQDDDVEGQGTLYANLSAFETGSLYEMNPDLRLWYRHPGLGEQ